MGQFMEPQVTTYNPQSRGFEDQMMDWISQLQGMETPETPYSETAARRASESTGAHGADMEKFFGGMMQGGGQQNLDQILADMDKMFGMQQQQGINQMKASGVPANSSAMARMMTQGMNQGQVQHNLGRGQVQLNEMGNVMNRQFQGAQGLGMMPSYYAGPSSIEQAMFGMQQPYDLARMQGLGNAYGGLFNQNYYQPERIEGPSGFDQWITPWLNPLMQGIGEGASSTVFG